MAFKRLEDEFGNVLPESNKAISENLNLEATEYPTISEVVAPPAESVASPENSNAGVAPKPVSEGSVTESFQTKMDNINRFTNTADGIKSADINSAIDVDAAVEASTAASTTTATAGVTASTAGTATVASLAGSFSVIAVAAVGMAAVAGGILQKEPVISSESYETGTNFIKYEIDVRELSENMDYKIKVSNPNFSIEYPIEEEGLQRQIVPGLTPYRKYDVDIIGVSKELGEIVYHTYTCRTNTLPVPKAVFQFTPNFDYILGRISLDYKVFISDFYNAGSNNILQIHQGEKELVNTKNIDEDNFFTGTIYNLRSLEDISAVAYTDYYDGLNTEYGKEIGSYGFEYVVPSDFVIKDDFSGTYTFGLDCFSSSMNFDDNKNILNVLTNLETDNENEACRVDILYDNKVIATQESKEKSISFELDPAIKDVDVKLTPIKYEDSEVIEFDPVILNNVNIDPKIFSYVTLDFDQNRFYLSLAADDNYYERLETSDVRLLLIQHNIDGTEIEHSDELNVDTLSNYNYEANYDPEIEDKTSDYVDYFELKITCNEQTIYDTTIVPKVNASFDASKYDINDDGNILIPYEVSIPDGAIHEKTVTMFGEGDDSRFIGNEDGHVLTETSGNLELNLISSNVLSNGVADVRYRKGGVYVSKRVSIDDLTLEGEYDYDVEYYAHLTSAYNLNIRFTTTINGKAANINPLAERDAYGGKELITYSYSPGRYYTVELENHKANVYITAPCFPEAELNYTFEDDQKVFDNLDPVASNVSAGYYNEKNIIYYVKEKNDDGTLNFYFDTNFEELSTNHTQMIQYEYSKKTSSNSIQMADSGDIYGKKYYRTEEFTTNYYVLRNVPDGEYKFSYCVLYQSSDNEKYEIEFNNNFGVFTGIEYNKDLKSINTKNCDAGVIETVDGNQQKKYIYAVGISGDATVLDSDITITHDGIDYIIPIKDEREYQGSGDNYEYYVKRDGYKLTIELGITLAGEPDPNMSIQSDVKYKTKFGLVDNTSADIPNKEKYTTERTDSVGVYSGTYDESKLAENLKVTLAENYRYSFELEVNDFEVEDNRDVLIVSLYSGDELVSSEQIRYDRKFVELYASYTAKDLRLVVTKARSSSSMYNHFEFSSYIPFESSELEFTLPEKTKLINDVSFVTGSYGEHTVKVTPTEDFASTYGSDFYICPMIYDQNGDMHQGVASYEIGATSVELVEIENQSYVVVKIYRCNYPSSGPDPSWDSIIGEYRFSYENASLAVDVDNVENVVNYNIDIPEDITNYTLSVLLPNSGTTVSLTDLAGTFEVTNEDNYGLFTFNVTYEAEDGTTVLYVLEYEVQV